MENIEIFFIIGAYTLILNYIFSQFTFLKDKKNISTHKLFTNSLSTPPFSGGIILLITIVFFISKENIYLSYLFFIFFFIGFLSDTNILKSANIRFILQIFFLIIFLNYLDISISSIRFEYIDKLLQNNFFKFFFSVFCILVLINGTNFIDGLNTLVIGYYILVLFFTGSLLGNFSSNFFNSDEMNILFVALVFLFILNFFELLYLGDGGAYLISIFFGVYLINLYDNNELISPYYIMNLLWYPAYENLFSIIRKISMRYSAFEPDNLHLHQIIYQKVKNITINKKISNTLTSLLINLFNLIVFYFATLNYSNTKFQLIIILFSLTIYNLLYFFLKKNLQNN